MSRFRFLIVLVLVAAPIACADATYTYTGAPFDTESGDPGYLAAPAFPLGDSIDLTVDFPAPLAPGLVDQTVIPISWSISAASFGYGGGGLLTGGGNFALEDSIFSTDSSGKIVDWLFSGFANPRGFSTSGTAGDEAHQFSAHGEAGSASTKTIGTWTAFTSVPEPSSLSLLVLGAALLSIAKRLSHALVRKS